MSWLIATILAYFLFAIAALGDKYLLAGAINPRKYTFYVGCLGAAVVLLFPFVNFYIPGLPQFFICFLAGITYVTAIFFLYDGLKNFEASKIIPAIGGLLPLFTFILSYIFSRGQEVLDAKGILAFIFLVSGGLFITWSKSTKISLKSLKVSALCAFFSALTYLLAKYSYSQLTFWNGFIWIRICVFLIVLSFLFRKGAKEEIFSLTPSFTRGKGILFIFNQVIGGGAFILQNWAIALAGLSYLSIIMALQGVQYLFLFIFALILSLKLPRILKEEVSKKIIFQKIFAILFIGTGLVFLAIK